MTDQLVELLFFDTFAHDNTEEINLDLVQFPKPVYVTEVRIIPLGARVQADFPGGVRLGATNPSQFHIEFFVNDLGKPGASTFETLGGFEYDQNGRINLDCLPDEAIRKIPTDGLVLKGLYTTITLAVYGTLTNNITEQIIQPVVNPSLPTQPNTIADAQQIISGSSIDAEWSQEPTNQLEYNAQSTVAYQQYNQQEPYNQEFGEYYNDVPKDPRSYHHNPENEWDNKSRNSRDYHQKSSNVDRDRPSQRDNRDREKRYSRSQSRDRDRSVREYRDMSRERDREWNDRDHDRQEYRSERDRTSEHQWEESNRGHDRERGRDRRHDDSYNRRERYREDREERKRPRTPPILSPKRPHTPQNDIKEESPPILPLEQDPDKPSERPEDAKPIVTKSPNDADNVQTEEITERMDVEEFEPILSDEDILDDQEQYQDIDYDLSSYTNNDDIIKLFTPGVTELQKYPVPKQFTIKDNCIIYVNENLKNTIGITDDYLKSSITKYVLENFERHNTEIKEEFIHLCEKLLDSIVERPQAFVDIAKLYTVTQSMTIQNMSNEDKELTSQVAFIIQTIADWLKIAMNYDMANLQDKPPNKIRHIKCGVRLAEWVCHSDDFIRFMWQNDFVIHKELLELCDREFMALSIKLMILKALDTYLLNKFAIEKFLLGNNSERPRENGFVDTLEVSEINGYKMLVESILKSPQVRLRFAINSILKKLNLYEMLHKMHSILIKLRNVANDISAEEINLITKSLNQILNYCQRGPLTFSQPKRFLPVASQFEIIRSETKNILVNYFKMFNVLQGFILLLTYPSTMNLPPIKTPIFEIVSTLLDNPEGLQYLSENAETVNVLLKCLLRSDEEIQYSIQDYVEVRSHNLGLNIAYKIQALYHIEHLLVIGKQVNYDCDAIEVIDQLHALFCLTFAAVGKTSCAEVLGMADNIQCLLQFFEHVDSKSDSHLSKLRKSPSTGYIIDLIYFTVTTVSNIPLLEKHSRSLIRIVNLVYDDLSANRFNELLAYVRPFESIPTLSYDNIASYLELVEKNVEHAIFNPGQLITSLRILLHLGISSHCNKSPVISDNPLVNYVELKYKHAILRLYSLDATTILTKILQKICLYFEQPNLYSTVFVSNQGLQIVNVIHPTILLLKQMLSYVVQCRNTKFKDLTNIPVLLQTYNLLNSYPVTSPGFHLAQDCKVSIVDLLLVYTQPVSDEFNEKDSLNKTLWTLMCGEVIKYVSFAPYTIISGLLILSELLPLPLPVQTQDDLGKDEIAWAINLRKLWSAHLHPHSSAIQDMIVKLCVSTHSQLLNLLRRICVQLSDLAANSALMIARGVLDSVYEALVPKEGAVVGTCTTHLARLLNFLACLVTHSTIKCAVLHLIHTNSNVTTKTDEKYGNLIQAFSQVLKSDVNNTTNVQAQECILSIIQSFCDTELTLLQMPGDGISEITSQMYLANAIPIKEHLLVYIDVMLDHLISAENSYVTYLPIVRTLLLLTEHDYGFYHLREGMLKRPGLFVNILNKLSSSFSKTNVECLSTLNTLTEFLRVCVTVEEADSNNALYTTRTMKLSLEEVKGLIGWTSNEEAEGSEEKHAFVILEGLLKKEVDENNSLETLLDGVTWILNLLRSPSVNQVKQEHFEEIVLPQPENLLVQYSCRTIFSSSDACDERLTDRYWLTTMTDEESDLEQVTCDLTEICRQNLSQDYNIVKEVEKLCRISRTEILDDKEKRNDDQKAKMKKPFVTPMRARGFARTVQQRPDLFRSRPPNTSRPPSLHVDDFVALETCGAQPTGPTGYNKISRDMLASTRIARGTRGRAFVTSERSMHQYNRQMHWWGAGMGRGPYQM